MKQTTQGLLGLAARRKAAGFTQETYADALGVKRSLLAAWEVGRLWPSARWLPDMAALLHCHVEDLYAPPEDVPILSQEGGTVHAGQLPESVL